MSSLLAIGESSWFVWVSHNFTLCDSSAVASQRPLGENTHHRTHPSFCFSVHFTCSVPVFQSFTTPAISAVTNFLPSDEKAAADNAALCPLKTPTCRPESRSHSVAVKSGAFTTTRFQSGEKEMMLKLGPDGTRNERSSRSTSKSKSFNKYSLFPLVMARCDCPIARRFPSGEKARAATINFSFSRKASLCVSRQSKCHSKPRKAFSSGCSIVRSSSSVRVTLLVSHASCASRIWV